MHTWRTKKKNSTPTRPSNEPTERKEKHQPSTSYGNIYEQYLDVAIRFWQNFHIAYIYFSIPLEMLNARWIFATMCVFVYCRNAPIMPKVKWCAKEVSQALKLIKNSTERNWKNETMQSKTHRTTTKTKTHTHKIAN